MGNRFPLVQQVKLDANGAGQVTVNLPGGWGEYEVGPSTVTVAPVAPNPDVVNIPRADTYHNGTSQTDRVSGTYSGHSATDPAVYRWAGGDYYVCVWSGGDAGALATFRVWVRQV